MDRVKAVPPEPTIIYRGREAPAPGLRGPARMPLPDCNRARAPGLPSGLTKSYLHQVDPNVGVISQVSAKTGTQPARRLD
jgi:hypothetical protein